MGIISIEEVFGRSISPIDKSIEGEDIQLVVSHLQDCCLNSQTFDLSQIDEDILRQAREQFDEFSRRGDVRLFFLINALGPLFRPIKPHSLDRTFRIDAYCLNGSSEEHRQDPKEKTRRGLDGVKLESKKLILDDILGDFGVSSESELFPKVYPNCDSCQGDLEYVRSSIVYEVPEAYFQRPGAPIIKEIRGRIKTRGDFADKITDKVFEINKNINDTERHSGKREIYDHLGVKIIARDQHKCYEVRDSLRRISDHFLFVDGFEKDRIANPKSNGYQDLKVVLAFPTEDSYLLHEVQIVTPEMEARNNDPERSHDFHKSSKWEQRMKIGPAWINLRAALGEIIGEENYNPQFSHLRS